MKAVLFASTLLLATLAGMLILSGGVSAVGPPSDNLTFPESPLKDTREETTPAVDSVLAEISRLPGSPPPTFGLEFSGPSEEDNFRVTGAENWYLFVDINTPGWLYIYEYYPPSSDPPGRWVAYKWKLLQEGQWRLGPFSAAANDPEGLHTYSAWFYGDDQWAAQPAQNNSVAWTYLKSPPAEKPPETPPVPPVTEETPPVKGETPGDQFYNFITNPIVLVFGPTVLILIVVFLLLLLRAYRKRALAAAVEASLPAGAAEAPVSGIPQTAS